MKMQRFRWDLWTESSRERAEVGTYLCPSRPHCWESPREWWAHCSTPSPGRCLCSVPENGRHPWRCRERHIQHSHWGNIECKDSSMIRWGGCQRGLDWVRDKIWRMNTKSLNRSRPGKCFNSGHFMARTRGAAGIVGSNGSRGFCCEAVWIWIPKTETSLKTNVLSVQYKYNL